MQSLTTPSQAPRLATSPWSILQGGLSLGIAYALPFIMIVFSPMIEQITGLRNDSTGGSIILSLIFIGTVAGGALFGLTTANSVGSDIRKRAAIVGGLTLPLAMFAGFAFAIQGETIQLGLSTHGLFTLVFPVMTAAVLLIVAVILGRTLSVGRPFVRALPAVILTWAAYMVAIYLLNELFQWQVGTGDRAMVKIAMVGNLVAATVGGAVWIASLRRSA